LGEGTASYVGIYSYFDSEISERAMKIAVSNLRRQKSLTPEGLTGVFTLKELEKDTRGKLSTAHMTAPVLNYKFGIKIPYPEEHIKATPIGTPRNSFRDYLTDFEYSRVRKPNHNNPKETDPSFYDIVFGNEIVGER